ncbi:MAG: LEA type 2 family protein, partial [Psychrobium sp.]|nr:LEA type 2 family protein [Psychrobium sp.]
MTKKIIVLLSTMLLCSCANLTQQLSNFVERPKVTFKRAALGQVTNNNIELRPTFNISNSNAFDLPIDKVSYQLSFNQKQVLDGETSEIGRIGAKQSKDITLGLNLTRQLLHSLKNSLLTTKKLDYSIKGQVKVMGLNIPFDHAATLY